MGCGASKASAAPSAEKDPATQKEPATHQKGPAEKDSAAEPPATTASSSTPTTCDCESTPTPAGAFTLAKKAALIVVDVQNDFITGTLANQYGAEAIVPVINRMRDSFPYVVISLDWHPEEHCSFVESANAGKLLLAGESAELKTFEAFQTVRLAGDADRDEHDQQLYPRHAVQGTDGAKCHKDLVVKDEVDGFVYKGTKPNIDSYSAFFDNCKANDTGLTKMLKDQGVTHVYCCGLVFDICVKSTALHGAEGGFEVAVVEDACKPLSEEVVPAVREELAKAGVRIVTSDDAIREVAG